MYPPMLPGRGQRPGEEGIDQERHLQELSRDYEGSPWLTALVVFSGFLVALVGTFDTLFLLGTAVTGRTWWPYAVILAALLGTHICLRAVRYGRRRSRQSGTGDRGRVTRKRTEHARNA
jgi:small-conductance mechanosensitive channel